MENHFNIAVKMEDSKTTNVQEFSFKHSLHSYERSSQRGMNAGKLATALAYGAPYFKQGLIFYVLGEDDIPPRLEKERTKLKNTVVVVDGDSGVVITCYRCSEPHKHIRRKSKVNLRTHQPA